MRASRSAVLAALPTLALLAVATSAHAAAPADLELVQFASGFSNPLAVRHAGDGSGRVYVVEQGGTIRTLSAAGVQLGTLLDVRGASTGFTSGGEQGLLGLAFHPAYPADPRLFVYYTDGNGDSVVASYTAAGSPPVADAASAAIVLRVDQDFTNHNGGDIHFGADGMLYIALGDGGSGNDPCNRAQTLDPDTLVLADGCAADGNFNGNSPASLALLGKILRIDVNTTTAAAQGGGLCGNNSDGSANYAVPASNPFADGATGNGCDEVWHFGLRNPYRFSFDRDTGDMFIGDVGQNTWEEVDYAAAASGGHNFGWDPCEGRYLAGSTTTLCNLPGATAPILDYRRSDGACALTGGYRYRGPISALDGDYIYGDYCTGEVFIAAENGGWSSTLWQDTPFNISSFGEDERGNLYLTNLFGGQVYRFESPGLIFADGFED